MIALVRGISARIADCELTHLDRVAIDVAAASREHARYVAVLAGLGCELLELPALDSHPDCVFVEDTAVVLPELAVMTRPGAASRRGELDDVKIALGEHRPLGQIEEPGTLDGGDVLVLGNRVYVGRSPRSNDEGITQLAKLLAPLGYEVEGVEFTGCLHLKSACTLASDDLLLVNPEWVDPARFMGVTTLAVPPEEPFAANVLAISGSVLVGSTFPNTATLLRNHRLDVHMVENSELAKAEGGLTCGSILID